MSEVHIGGCASGEISRKSDDAAALGACTDEHRTSAGPPRCVAVISAMIAKVGAAARLSQSAAQRKQSLG